MYLQAEDETIVQGNIVIAKEEKVVALAGISMAVVFGEEMAATVNELVDACECARFYRTCLAGEENTRAMGEISAANARFLPRL